MTEKQIDETKQRTQIEDLPTPETNLNEEEMQEVKGGASDYLLELGDVKGESKSTTPDPTPRRGR